MTKMQQWTAITVVAVLAVLGGGWLLLVKHERSQATDYRAQAASAQDGLSTARTQLDQLLAEKKNLPAEERTLARIATRIPADPAEPTLIRQLQTAAHTAGVDFTSLTPATPTPVAAAVSTGAVPAVTSTLPLYSMPVSIEVTGSYFNVEMFDHLLETLPRTATVSALTIAPAVAAASGSTGGTTAAVSDSNDVTATIQASVYLSPSTTAGTAGATTGTTGAAGTTSTGSTGATVPAAGTVPGASTPTN
jgi:Tfp pilus assembly protein PilO